MNETVARPMRVPPRLVLASIVGLWSCYFLLATLRGVVLDYDFSWDLLSRRLVVTLGAVLVTAALWPVLIVTAHRPFWLRVGLIMVLSLPAAMLITAVNDLAFADINHPLEDDEAYEDGVGILRDESGSVVEMGNGRLVLRNEKGKVVEIGNGRLVLRNEKGSVVAMGDGKTIIRKGGDGAAPAPPPLPASSSPPLPPSPPVIDGAVAPVPKPAAPLPPKEKNFWKDNVDLILGRYFLLLAWAAIYLALANAEQARAAERREGDYRRAAQAAELRSLRYQINPHFLFNTLNSLSALVLTGKSEPAERMIQSLASFYRRSLAGDSTGDVSLGEEIGLQRLYLEIEGVRFPERLRTVVNVPPELARVLVPGMILQPLVENSIKYAVAASRSPVTVAIAAWAENGKLVLSVSDDGPGGALQDGCGIGLANVRDRLQARFDGAASLEAGPRGEGGFATVIRLPLVYG